MYISRQCSITFSFYLIQIFLVKNQTPMKQQVVTFLIWFHDTSGCSLNSRGIEREVVSGISFAVKENDESSTSLKHCLSAIDIVDIIRETKESCLTSIRCFKN